jgi:hypothetical protein
MSECDDQMRRYEKQLKDVQETMKRGEIINWKTRKKQWKMRKM